MSAPAAKARSLPPSTMQRTPSSRSSSCSALTSSSISSSDSAFSASGRLSRTTATLPSGSTTTWLIGTADMPKTTTSRLFLSDEALDCRSRLVRRHRQGEPVARVIDRLVPREVLPEVQVLLRVARRLRQLAHEVLDDRVDLRVELRRGNRPVDEAPLRGPRGGDLVAHQHDLARAAVADHDRQPLGRAADQDRTVLRPDVADVDVVAHHGEVARHLELVTAADADAVDAGDGGLADLAEPVVSVLERAEPLPVLVRLAEVLVGPGPEVRADAEGAVAGAGEHDDAQLVVPRRVLGCVRELPQHLEVEGVQAFRPVERDRRPPRILLVDDPLEAELGRVTRRRVRRLGHAARLIV